MDTTTWSKAFALLLMFLCLATAVSYVVYVDKAGSSDRRNTLAQVQPQAQGAPVAAQRAPAPAAADKAASAASLGYYKIAFKICLLASVACAGGWFAYAFTGEPEERRQEQVKFAYFFVIGSFAVLMIPPFVTSQAIGSELIGIVSGCVVDADAPAQLRCDPEPLRPPQKTGEQVETKGGAAAAAAPAAPAAAAAPAAGAAAQGAAPATRTAPTYAHNQWLVNLGGALRAQSNPACTGNLPGDCALGSADNRVDITGGVVVPLPLVIIALFGGAISLSRRVPEIQKRSEPGYAGTAAETVLDARQAREELVFQIMQFVSAPLIAITAHQVIGPSTQANAVALAFLAGFGSETILLMIRGVAEGVRPRSTTQPAATADQAAVKGGVQTSGAAAAGGTRTIDGKSPRLGSETPGAPGPAPVHIRLCIAHDGLDAGSLALSVDGGAPGAVPNDGCVELALVPGQPHRVEAHGRRAGREVRGELRLTAGADDEGRPFEITLD